MAGVPGSRLFGQGVIAEGAIGMLVLGRFDDGCVKFDFEAKGLS